MKSESEFVPKWKAQEEAEMKVTSLGDPFILGRTADTCVSHLKRVVLGEGRGWAWLRRVAVKALSAAIVAHERSKGDEFPRQEFEEMVHDEVKRIRETS